MLVRLAVNLVLRKIHIHAEQSRGPPTVFTEPFKALKIEILFNIQRICWQQFKSREHNYMKMGHSSFQVFFVRSPFHTLLNRQPGIHPGIIIYNYLGQTGGGVVLLERDRTWGFWSFDKLFSNRSISVLSSSPVHILSDVPACRTFFSAQEECESPFLLVNKWRE